MHCLFCPRAYNDAGIVLNESLDTSVDRTARDTAPSIFPASARRPLSTTLRAVPKPPRTARTWIRMTMSIIGSVYRGANPSPLPRGLLESLGYAA